MASSATLGTTTSEAGRTGNAVTEEGNFPRNPLARTGRRGITGTGEGNAFCGLGLIGLPSFLFPPTLDLRAKDRRDSTNRAFGARETPRQMRTLRRSSATRAADHTSLSSGQKNRRARPQEAL